jgi:hypothetical protein
VLSFADLADVAGFQLICPYFPASFERLSVQQAHLSCRLGQSLAHDVDIGQGELAENLLAVLVQAAIARPSVMGL